MPLGNPKFAVLGTGNSGQTYAADIALKGFEVNLAEVSQFQDTLKAIEARGGIEMEGEVGSGFAKPAMLTTDLKKAIKGVDVIIIGGSAYAHEPFSKALIDDFEDGQFIFFTSNFGAMRFKRWMDQAGKTTRITPVETMSLIYATRAVEPGKVSCIGVKDRLSTATLPGSRIDEFLKLVEPVFPMLAPADNVLVTSLNNLNPIVHPPMVLFNAGRIEATGGDGWNLYADGATESVARIMESMDAERMSLLERAGLSGLSFRESFESLYKAYDIARDSLSETLRQSPIHGNPAFPAPGSVDTRYINEDLPFGLAPWSAIGREWGVSVPTVDACLQIASTMLRRDYHEQGLTIADLGIEGLSPEEVRTLVD